MTRNEQLKTIRNAYDEIPEIYDGFYNIRERLFQMNLAAERQHRHGSHPPCGLSLSGAARLFTVSHLLDGWTQPDRFTVDDILHVRNEVLYAQAYAKENHDALSVWATKWTGIFTDVDYAELMKVPNE